MSMTFGDWIIVAAVLGALGLLYWGMPSTYSCGYYDDGTA